MRIHITYTGGTIGMIDSPNGLIPGADTRGWLFRLLEDAHMDASLFTFTELDPLIDSSNATPDNWQTMLMTCVRITMMPTRSWCCMAPTR